MRQTWLTGLSPTWYVLYSVERGRLDEIAADISGLACGRARGSGVAAGCRHPAVVTSYGVGAVSTFAAPWVGVVVNAQSVAASFESCPSGFLISEPSTVFESATAAGSGAPSTSEYVWPSIVVLVIEPSYDRASSSVLPVVSISATPSGAPFCASFGTTRYAPAASVPVNATRSYSAESPPFTNTSAMPSSVAVASPLLRISTKPAVSVPTWS